MTKNKKETIYVKWRNSTPRLTSTPEQRNENIQGIDALTGLRKLKFGMSVGYEEYESTERGFLEIPTESCENCFYT